MSQDDEHVVVAGALQRGARMVDVDGLDKTCFADPIVRALFDYGRKYWHRTGNAMDLALVRTKLEEMGSVKADRVLELVAEYEGYKPITEAEFRDGLGHLGQDHSDRVLKEQYLKAGDLMVAEDYEGARRAMRTGLIDAGTKVEDRPADIRSPGMIQQERAAVRSGKPLRRQFDIGFDAITDRVPICESEQTILAGYTADGKTQWSKCLAYNVAMNSGVGVLYVSLEMTLREMTVMFVAQHAWHLDAQGVRWVDILNGTASKKDRALYDLALQDFEIVGGEGDEHGEVPGPGGRIYIWAPEDDEICMSQYVDRVVSMADEGKIGATVLDWLELVEPDRDTGHHRHNLSRMCKQGKRMARRAKVWSLICHHISRKGRVKAEQRSPRHYVLDDLGESTGVEKAADHVLWIYTDEVYKLDREARVGIAKARKGQTKITGFPVFADFERSLVASTT